METDFMNDSNWYPVNGFPGYEISMYGPVCKVKKNGTRELLVHYYDRKDKKGWVYVTLWKNGKFYKMPLRHLVRDTLMPIMQKMKQNKENNNNISVAINNHKVKKTMNRVDLDKKFNQMVDGFEPDKMSASSYMKYLRQQGYRFTTHHLSTMLAKKKADFESHLETQVN